VGLKGFERRLERLVEGVFARAFKSSLRPVELGRRLVREMDDQRTVNVKGQVAAPNDFSVTLGPDDHEQFAEIEESLTRELSEAARSHARDEGYVFMGPVEVHLNLDPELRTGSFGLSARFKEGVGGTAGGSLVLPDGKRILRFENFQTGENTDLFVWLSEVPKPANSAQAVGTPHVEISNLKSTIGSQNYEIPASIPTEKIKSVVIWCQPVQIAYAAVALA